MKGSCMHAVFLRVRTVAFPQVHSYTYIPKCESCVWFSSHSHRRSFTGSGETLILYNDVPSRWQKWEKFEDDKGVIRSRKSNGRRTYNTMNKRQKYKQDLQNITQKMKDRATWTPLRTGSAIMCSGKIGSSGSTCGISCYKSDDMSWMRKWQDCDYDKRNISVVICDTDTQ
jgi:hypothetical protein